MKTFTVALTAMLTFVGIAHAQDTAIGIAPLMDFVLPIILTIISATIAAALPVLLARLAARFNLQIEQSKRDALQVTLTNAAGGLVQELGDRARDLKLDVRDPKVAEAVRRVVQGAPDALKWAGLTPDEIARRVLEKVPQIAPAPSAETTETKP